MGKKRKKPPPAVGKMDHDRFWALVDWSREQTHDCEEQVVLLTEALAAYDPEDIVEFGDLFWEREIEAYRADLWQVAAIINGVCSDDGFTYFRGWVIAQGRTFFEAVLEDPARAGDCIPRGSNEYVECEAMLSVAGDAYMKRMRKDMPFGRRLHFPDKPKGEWREDEELKKVYPDLWKRFVEKG
jgi:hypothetical protein